MFLGDSDAHKFLKDRDHKVKQVRWRHGPSQSTGASGPSAEVKGKGIFGVGNKK